MEGRDEELSLTAGPPGVQPVAGEVSPGRLSWLTLGRQREAGPGQGQQPEQGEAVCWEKHDVILTHQTTGLYASLLLGNTILTT